MHATPPDAVPSDDDLETGEAWRPVIDSLARRYPAIPRAVVRREVIAAQLGNKLFDAESAYLVKDIADRNLAAINEALRRGSPPADTRQR